MKRMSAPLFVAALGLTLFAQSKAHASFVPWTYNWGRSPIAVQADSPGTGGLSLTDETTLHAVGTSDIVATNIRSFSSAPRTAPDHFTAKPYTLSLFLKDDASGQSTTLTFSGTFSGALSSNSANITTAFTGKISQTVTLGKHTYTVSLGNFAPPGPPTASNAGSISAHVLVDQDPDGGGGGGHHGAPEPSTMLLSLLGLSGLGAGAWKKLMRKA
ncbi:MAG TPA: hypothetical protein VGZ25_13555 [Gemmataceae bacterium]|jgi:hypothetical protein|nr:hypothetical protein [Gemmataceae bacterium]